MKPNTEKLALIAAALMRDGMKPQQAAVAALKLWKATEAAIEADDRPDTTPPVPMPKQFPVTNMDVVLMAAPELKGRTADAAKAFRDYVATPPAGDYATAMKVVIHDADTYCAAFRQFKRWYDQRKQTNTSAARSDAAKASWKNRPKKKTGARPKREALREIVKKIDADS